MGSTQGLPAEREIDLIGTATPEAGRRWSQYVANSIDRSESDAWTSLPLFVIATTRGYPEMLQEVPPTFVKRSRPPSCPITATLRTKEIASWSARHSCVPAATATSERKARLGRAPATAPTPATTAATIIHLFG